VIQLISHRGNLSGPEPARENTAEFIDEAIKEGYPVEIDVRKNEDGLWLGHDEPISLVDINWLTDRKDNLLVHSKNVEALKEMLDNDMRTFYHASERHVIIANTNLIWSHDISEATDISIIPLMSKSDIEKFDLKKNNNMHGICSDNVIMLYRIIKNI